jgi:hypothetical protein
MACGNVEHRRTAVYCNILFSSVLKSPVRVMNDIFR